MNKLFKSLGVLTLICAISLFLLNSCTTQDNFDWREYTFPTEYQHTTYTIEQEEDDYSAYTYIDEERDLTDEEKQEIFETARERKEALDKYETLTDVWSETTFEQEEEQRIEDYCEEYGFFSCYDIKYTCNSEYRCQKVYIECEDYGFDPSKLSHQYYGQDKDDECRNYDVTVDEETFDIRKLEDDSFLDDAGFQWE